MTARDPAAWLVSHPRFRWRDGMLDRHGARLVLDAWKHPSVDAPDANVAVNLADPATAGVLLGCLDEEGALTDVVRADGGWVVAVRIEGQVAGFEAETLGEAAAWALLALWGEDLGLTSDVEVA